MRATIANTITAAATPTALMPMMLGGVICAKFDGKLRIARKAVPAATLATALATNAAAPTASKRQGLVLARVVLFMSMDNFSGLGRHSEIVSRAGRTN